jgi:hypothetical protein
LLLLSAAVLLCGCPSSVYTDTYACRTCGGYFITQWRVCARCSFDSARATGPRVRRACLIGAPVVFTCCIRHPFGTPAQGTPSPARLSVTASFTKHLCAKKGSGFAQFDTHALVPLLSRKPRGDARFSAPVPFACSLTAQPQQCKQLVVCCRQDQVSRAHLLASCAHAVNSFLCS